jgi:hypothetical protein
LEDLELKLADIIYMLEHLVAQLVVVQHLEPHQEILTIQHCQPLNLAYLRITMAHQGLLRRISILDMALHQIPKVWQQELILVLHKTHIQTLGEMVSQLQVILISQIKLVLKDLLVFRLVIMKLRMLQKVIDMD